MTVHEALDPPILSLTLDRPKANAFDVDQVAALTGALERAAAVDGARVLVIKGAGDVSFSAGADMSATGPLAAPGGLEEWTKNAHAFLDRIASFPVPVIAAMRRPAVGGGFELALACHLRVLAKGAHVAIPEIHRGYLPSWAALERLVPLGGMALAADMLLTGRRVPADEALSRGVVHRVVDDAEAAAYELAELIAELPPLAVRAALDQLRGVEAGESRAAVRSRELADLERLVRTEDTVEGVLAFFEKRKPRFKGK